jgi:hypothetical protein
MKKIFRGLLAAVAAGSFAVALTSAPAQAAIPTDGTTTDPVTGAVTQVKSAVDKGGVKHTFKIVWTKEYKDPVGKIRASVPTLTDYRSDELTVAGGESADAGEDVIFAVSSHGTVRWTQYKNFDGIDLDDAADDQVSFNPRNPVSDEGKTFIKIQAGVDGDGAGNTPFVYFYQPAGLPGPA